MSLDCNHVVLNTMPNRNRRCRSANSGRLMTVLDLSPADFRRFLIVLVDTSIGQPVLLEYETGCEWHPYNQTLQCPVITIRCCPWSVGSWQVFHIVGLCLFSHQSTDYIIVVAHLMSNSFEGHPCCMYANYLPSLCF